MRVGSIGMPALQAEEVEFINADSDTTIKTLNSETVNVKPPVGYIYEILAARMKVPAPAGGGSGTHTLQIQSETETIYSVFASDAYNKALQYYDYRWGATNTVIPAEELTQLFALRGLRIDDANGLDFFYTNLTDVSQAQTREFRLWVRKIKVAT